MYDQRNPAFYCGSPEDQRGLMPFLITFVPEAIKSRIHSISIQQIVAAYKETVTADWLKEFEIKYGLKLETFKKDTNSRLYFVYSKPAV